VIGDNSYNNVFLRLIRGAEDKAKPDPLRAYFEFDYETISDENRVAEESISLTEKLLYRKNVGKYQMDPLEAK
jgi:hypothetical protein